MTGSERNTQRCVAKIHTHKYTYTELRRTSAHAQTQPYARTHTHAQTCPCTKVLVESPTWLTCPPLPSLPTSVFPSRGQPDLDRDFRHPRVKGERALKRDIAKAKSLFSEGILAAESVPQTPRLSRIATEWDLLPPVPDIISAVGGFTKHYFQLGFIQKELFPRRLEANHRSVSVLLLLGILSISARFTPAIACSYGGGIQATELFMERAQNLANLEIYEEPSLERCQGFYLLSLAQQGSGWKNRSYVSVRGAV